MGGDSVASVLHPAVFAHLDDFKQNCGILGSHVTMQNNIAAVKEYGRISASISLMVVKCVYSPTMDTHSIGKTTIS